jgi:hypothetical protein
MGLHDLNDNDASYEEDLWYFIRDGKTAPHVDEWRRCRAAELRRLRWRTLRRRT